MSPLLDHESIILRLQHLKEYLKILKQLQTFSLKEIDHDAFKKGALLHYLQMASEICIDIGQLIIAAENFSVPQEASQIFIILGEEKILPQKFARDFSAVARFRNLLVHEYTKIDMAKVYRYLQKDLSNFSTFAQAIARYMKKK